MPTYGLEEELFIVDHRRRVSPQSLYYMAKILWRNPRRNYRFLTSNMARGPDLKEGTMSCMEFATATHAGSLELMEELLRRRGELARACDERLIAIGHLADYHAPSNIAALHIHIGNVEPEPVYRRLVYFLPLLSLLTLSSPLTREGRFGHSFRLASGYALGPLRGDPTYRFQDIIYAKRLGTIEVRCLDSVWDPWRLSVLLRAVEAIVDGGKLPEGGCGGRPAASGLDEPQADSDIAEYNALREQIAKEGWSPRTGPYLEERMRRLRELVELPEAAFKETPAQILAGVIERHGIDAAYDALDRAYRSSAQIPSHKLKEVWSGTAAAPDFLIPPLPQIAAQATAPPEPGAAPPHVGSPEPGAAARPLSLPQRVFRSVVGALGFYLPNFPYKIYKFRKEWSPDPRKF